jgi:hypothetical protein
MLAKDAHGFTRCTLPLVWGELPGAVVNPVKSTRRKLLVIAAAVGVLALLGTCAWRNRPVVPAVSLAPAAREADQHARNAGIAMLKHNLDEPAAYAADRVVGGSLPGTQIDALAVSGSTRHGVVLLRIIVQQEHSEFALGWKATRCYRYYLRDSEPHRVDPCPSSEPLLLPSRPPEAQLPTNAAATFARAIGAMTAGQRADAATTNAWLTKSFHSTGVVVTTATAPDGAVGVAVSAYGNLAECLGARLPVDGPPVILSLTREQLLPGEGGCNAELFARQGLYLPAH